MKKISTRAFFFVILLVLVSCNNNDKLGFLSIPVDSNEDNSLKLSEISESVEAIELEVTDESLISSVMDVLYTDNYYIIRDRKNLMSFDKKGKFIRKIGSVGQGPGEYENIIDVAVDNDNEKIFIYTNKGKIICYDFNGFFLKETPTEYYKNIRNIFWIDGKLLAASEQVNNDSSNLHHIVLYSISATNLSVIDSIEITKFKSESFGAIVYNDYISQERNNTYLFYTDYSSRIDVLDTLYL